MLFVNSKSGRGKGFVNQPFGKNMVAEISHEIAMLLGKPNIKNYTFHSFRRSSALTARNSAHEVATGNTAGINMVNFCSTNSEDMHTTSTDVKLETDPLELEEPV